MARRLSSPPLSRRQLIGAASGLGVLGSIAGVPRFARAAGSDRRFIFVFASGGWDLTWGLVPMFDNDRVDTPTDGSAPATVGGHVIVDGPGRPAVKSWFERWGDRTAFLHGFEVRSVAHFNCRRILFTGEAASFGDDWPTLIASEGVGLDTALPHLIVSGPGYASSFPDLAARVGQDGQLGALLDLEMLSRRDTPLSALPSAAEDAVAAYLSNRSAVEQAAAHTAAGAHLYGSIGRHQDAIPDLEAAFAATDIGSAGTFTEQLQLACDVLQGGISRCALVKHNGFNDMTWDSHGGIEGQALHYQDLFEGLEVLMDELAVRRGPSGGALLDDTCVVVLSEMSRHPALNLTGGKDHWTWTSAMLVGSGVNGGHVAGAYDSDVFGMPIDPTTGLSTPSGHILQARHLGATLLALADIDPGPHFSVETPPVMSLLA